MSKRKPMFNSLKKVLGRDTSDQALLQGEDAEKLLNYNAEPLDNESPDRINQIKELLLKAKLQAEEKKMQPKNDALNYRKRFLSGEDVNSLERVNYPEPLPEESEEEYLQRLRSK